MTAALAAAVSGLLLASAKAAVVVVLVLAVRALAGRRLPPRARTALWLLVAVRLLLPVGPASPWSLFALAPGDAAAAAGGGRVLPGLGGGAGPAAATGAGDAAGWSGLAALPGQLFETLLAAAVIAWLAGVAVLLLRRRAAACRLDRLLRHARPVEHAPARRLLAECRGLLGVRREVELAESAAISGPCLCPPRRRRPGGRHPCILLPRGAAAALGEDRLRHVLLHELAHLAHRDLAVRRTADLLRTLHWFNPLVHLAASALREDQELAADERALRHLPAAEHRRYGRTLLDLLPGAAVGTPAAAFVETRKQLHRRILMIARFAPRHRLAAAAALALFTLLAGLLLTDGGRAAAAPAVEGTAPPAAAAAGAVFDPVELQRRAIDDMRWIGRALWAWSEAHPSPSLSESQGADAAWDWSRCPAVSHAALSALLVPDVVRSLPETDPWGRAYELCLHRAGAVSAYRIGIRSAGADGRAATAPYAGGPFPAERLDEDLVWIDGVFVRWPER
jgi:beta-lactamase regulating signal transducer with metallopeptidase domain